MIQKRTQLSVIVVAALAILAVAAVMLLAGGNPAQADTAATIAPDDGGGHLLPQQADPTPSPTPRHAAPEPCPGETGNSNQKAARVVDSGSIALFDVYWNPVEGELTNTVCPPTVTHVPATPSSGFDKGTPARDDRVASNIDITAKPPTIIHIPSSAKINLSDITTYGNKTYGEMYEKVVEADNKEDRNADGVDDDGDGVVWALPACPTDGVSFNGLCLSFSAALLKPADWLDFKGGANGAIDYLVNHVHQVDIDKQDPRYVLAYNVPAAGSTKANAPLWNSSDARKGKVTVAPGGYHRPLWFFTDRGTYEFQVHIQGYPDTEASDPVSKDKSVTSDVREYILHVGAEADLGVEMKVTPADTSDTSLDPGDDVTIEVTASNAAGNDVAEKTRVDVALPEGLSYSSHVAATGTGYDSATGVWTVGELASGASKTLTITAKVDAGTRGKALTTQATISATEAVEITETVKNEKTVVTYQVPVPDPNPGNDTAAGTTTVASKTNADPMFQVTRSVPENSPAETLVGNPIAVREPDSRDTLTFGLTGDGADNFTASSVSGGAQIAVASGANLDYETRSSYALVLTVSDGLDHEGNTDTAIDHTIGVQVEIDDVTVFTVTLSASDTSPTVGDTITFTVSIENPPVPVSQLHFRWSEQDYPTGDGSADSGTGDPGVLSVTHNAAVTRDYQMAFWHLGEGNNILDEVVTNVVRVTWNSK